MLTYDPQRLLEDHSLDIPTYLQRDDDGSDRWPDTPAPLQLMDVARPSEREVTDEDRRAIGRARDLVAIEKLKRELAISSAASAAAKKQQHALDRAEEKRVDNERKARIIKKRRVEIHEEFKWDWEK